MTKDVLIGNRVHTVSLYVVHLRAADRDWIGGELHSAHRLREIGFKPSAKGGMTLVQVEFPDGNVARGAAHCSPKDNYCKATGRAIALGRALKLAEDYYARA